MTIVIPEIYHDLLGLKAHRRLASRQLDLKRPTRSKSSLKSRMWYSGCSPSDAGSIP